MPTASYALFPNLFFFFFLPSERDRDIYFAACFLHSSAQNVCVQNVFVSDAWPAPATYHRPLCEHCNQGVGRSPKERAPFRFHGAVVGFVARCLPRTRNLAASNKDLAEFFSSRSWPNIWPGIAFFLFFSKFGTFSVKICAHSEWYRNLVTFFLATSRFHWHRS